MNFTGVVFKFTMKGDCYTLTLDEMTREQFKEAIKLLDIPIVFVDGMVSKPALDNFTGRSENDIVKGWIVSDDDTDA
jgi:hypothetical protein